MKRVIFSISLLLTAIAAADYAIISEPERRIYVTSTGAVLEWQPGLGIVVLSAREVTQLTHRRASRSDGKTIVQAERSIRVQPVAPAKRPLGDRLRADQRARDEGESLMEEVAPLE